jgi:hypothetical protein
MRRELDSTISVTSFLILAFLAMLVFSGCGKVNGPGLQSDRNACGYTFDLESNPSTVQDELKQLTGVWRDNHSAGFTTIRVNGQELHQKNGFRFDFLTQVYGEVLIRFSSVSPTLIPHSVQAPVIEYDAIRIGAPLAGFADGTYRPLELYKADARPSYQNCRTYAYKIVDGNNLIITPGKTYFLSGTGTVPPIQAYLKDIASPAKYRYVRHQ